MVETSTVPRKAREGGGTVLGRLQALRQRADALLDQQFWCWGQDRRCLEGALLTAYGFSRHRPSFGVRGSTAYTLRITADEVAVLWGFGLFNMEWPLWAVSSFREAPSGHG